jgi:hypothetical protein
MDAADRTLISELKSSSDASPIGLIARDAESLQMGHLADVAGWLNVRFAPIVLKNSVLKPTVIADSFRTVRAGDRIDDGSAAG